jgi:hypothetical protein
MLEKYKNRKLGLPKNSKNTCFKQKNIEKGNTTVLTTVLTSIRGLYIEDREETPRWYS